MATGDKRRAPRVRHDSVLEIFDDRGRLIDAVVRLVDVSAVGAAFASTLALSKGETVRARLRLLDSDPLEIRGRVVRVQEKANFSVYGIEFESVTVSDARRRSS